MLSPRSIVLHRLQEIRDLPTLPEIVSRLDALGSDPRAGAREWAAAIETDPAIAARLLRLANSAYYRQVGDDVSSISQAVVVLGANEVRRVCLALAAMKMFAAPSMVIDHRLFWRHSLTTARATRTVARHVGHLLINEDEAYVAGLLHEIGALVLDQYFERIYPLVFGEAQRTGRPIHLVEQEFLRIQHAEIGAMVLRHWKLPTRLVSAVCHHHDPSRAQEDHRLLCDLVHVADCLVSERDLSGPGESLLGPPSARSWSALGLSADAGEELLRAIESDADRSSLFLALAA